MNPAPSDVKHSKRNKKYINVHTVNKPRLKSIHHERTKYALQKLWSCRSRFNGCLNKWGIVVVIGFAGFVCSSNPMEMNFQHSTAPWHHTGRKLIFLSRHVISKYRITCGTICQGLCDFCTATAAINRVVFGSLVVTYLLWNKAFRIIPNPTPPHHPSVASASCASSPKG